MSFDEDLDTYDLDVSDDPFEEAAPSSKKRKQSPAAGDDGLGLEEVEVTKRQRAPAVKLDEARLLSDAGLPKLRRTAASKLKFKGRGHEFSDAARLLSFYQMWLDDLFPKARFLDALAMVEKVGHKKSLVIARAGWIEEERRAQGAAPDDDFDPYGNDDDNDDDYNKHAGEGQKKPSASAPKTPPRQSSVPGDEDLYGSTPGARPVNSIFGNPSTKPAAGGNGQDIDEEEDLDALMAEAEMAEQEAAAAKKTTTGSSTTGGAGSTSQANDFADDEAAMAEMDGW